MLNILLFSPKRFWTRNRGRESTIYLFNIELRKYWNKNNLSLQNYKRKRKFLRLWRKKNVLLDQLSWKTTRSQSKFRGTTFSKRSLKSRSIDSTNALSTNSICAHRPKPSERNIKTIFKSNSFQRRVKKWIKTTKPNLLSKNTKIKNLIVSWISFIDIFYFLISIFIKHHS